MFVRSRRRGGILLLLLLVQARITAADAHARRTLLPFLFVDQGNVILGRAGAAVDVPTQAERRSDSHSENRGDDDGKQTSQGEETQQSERGRQ
jgi:hypothetical protein